LSRSPAEAYAIAKALNLAPGQTDLLVLGLAEEFPGMARAVGVGPVLITWIYSPRLEKGGVQEAQGGLLLIGAARR
jgi:hypothetical protein